MRYNVEICDDMLNMRDLLMVETCQYGITMEQVANLRDLLEAEGYDWNEIAYVWKVAA